MEALLFMRDVRSANYFEQMKGRGTRTIDFDDLQKVTRTARHAKTHFVIIDAVGVTRSKKTDSRSLERKPDVPLKDLLGAVAMGAQDEDLFASLANRLIRLEKQLTDDEKNQLVAISGGKTLQNLTKGLLDAYNPDVIETVAQPLIDALPPYDTSLDKKKQVRKETQEQLARDAAAPFTGRLNEFIENVRKNHEQIIDNINPDTLVRAEWDKDAVDNARQVVQEFADYIKTNKDEITALSIFYDQPYRRRDLTYAMVKELLDTLKQNKPQLAPHNVWQAYQQLDEVNGNSPQNELVSLVSLVRHVTGIDSILTPYDKTVDSNFKRWIFGKHSGAGEKFNEEQMAWLRMVKYHVATSFHLDIDDLNYTPFDARGGAGKMQQLFGREMNQIIEEMNEALAV